MIGLGMSSISDSWSAFAQNVKTVKEYQQLVSEGEIPVFRGHILSKKDLIIRKHILELMCQFQTQLSPQFDGLNLNESLLKELEDDGLIKFSSNTVEVLEEGKPFVRNVCMAFDAYLNTNLQQKKRFSMTV